MESTNKIRDECVGENVLTIPQYHDEFDGFNKCRFGAQLFILLDCSGSTRCQSGYDRHGGKLEGSVNTKVIIAAECEGIMWTLMSFIKNYDMTGTTLKFITFASNHTTYSYNITSNNQLYSDVICRIGDFTLNNGENTNLYGPLKEVLSNLSSENANYIILATDGQPNNKTQVLEILKEKTESNYLLFIIV